MRGERGRREREREDNKRRTEREVERRGQYRASSWRLNIAGPRPPAIPPGSMLARRDLPPPPAAAHSEVITAI